MKIEKTAADDRFKVLAKNVKDFRISLGWSFKEFAARVGITENTLARIQRGEPCSLRTQSKIAAALSMKIDALWLPDISMKRGCFHFTDGNPRWSFLTPQEGNTWSLNPEPERVDPEIIQDPAERLRLGKHGLSSGFCRQFRSHLSFGYHGAVITELYRLVEPMFASNVVALCHYVLQGTLLMTIEGETKTVHAGEMIVCEAHLLTALEPSEQVRKMGLPTVYLGVTLNLGEKKEQKRPYNRKVPYNRNPFS